jgi:hypothetical protein
MFPKNRASVIAMLLAGVLAAMNLGCGSSTPTPPPAISVSLSVATATIEVGATGQFTATVKNDSANKGVNWSVSCSALPCGTVSPTSTASGAPSTFTPPASQASELTVNVTAASASDPTATATVIVTVPAVAVNLSATSATLNLGATAPFSATVINDGTNAGVNWTVSCPQAACGSVSQAQTGSGAATTYTAPTAPPSGTLLVTLTATSVTDSAVLASATITVPGIVITISPNNPSVESGGTQQFTATVTGDPSNGAVTWQLLTPHIVCNPITRKCFKNGWDVCGTCGAVSPTSTPSGAPITYTAPGTAPGDANLQAVSVTNSTASGIVPVNVLPISISMSPGLSAVALTKTQQVSATVTNDATNRGVAWTLAQNGVACAPACGTVTPANTASGAVTTYTAPSTASSLPLVTISATSVEDNTKTGRATATLTTSAGAAACDSGSGSESLLKGQYAFLLRGTDMTGFPILAGSFTADGTGKVTGGERDGLIGGIGGNSEADVTINSAGSAYAVGPDHRGCLVLAIADGRVESYRFALGSLKASSVATAGQIIKFGDSVGSGNACAGAIRLQDPTSFSAGQFKGNYAFGVYAPGTAMAGVLAPDGVSALTSADLDAPGTLGWSNFSSTPGGSFTCCSANGRGTLTLQYNGSTNPFYMINSGDAFLLNRVFDFEASGEAIAIPPGTTFTQKSLSGASVLRQAVGTVVDLAAANADGSGTVTINDNTNNAGVFSASNRAVPYQVGSDGRVSLTVINYSPVIYLYGANEGFIADAGGNFGILEPQTGGPFSDSSFSGAYMFGTENPQSGTVTLQSGVLTADGSGNAPGTADQSNSTGLAPNQSLNLNYSVAADGTGNVGTGTTAIVISPSKLAYINNTDPNPTITVVEK